MNKSIYIGIFLFLVLSVNVSAWHCVDTDESKPQKVNGKYGSWGDNALLGGTSSYWLSDNNVPEGCTGTQGNYQCQDFCSGTTLREFYCDDREPTTEKYKDCHYEGQGRNRHKVCEWKTKTVNHPGETVISWEDYSNSKDCGDEEVPEFGFVAGSVAAVGALGLFAYRRK